MSGVSAARLLKLNRLVRSPRLKFLGVYLADLLGIRYTVLRFDPIIACNLRCQMCYFSDPEWRASHKGRFSWEEVERIAEQFFPQALQLNIGCGMEPTVFKGLPELVKLGTRFRVPFISLTTNGQLLAREHLEGFISDGLHELTLSTHGVLPETYEAMMPNARFDRFMDVLESLDEAKSSLGVDTPRLRLNYTVNPDNLGELEGFFETYGHIGVHSIQVRPVVDWGNVSYEKKDLRPILDDYHRILSRFNKECRRRNIVLLSNPTDPTYQDANHDASVYLEGVARFIRPGMVWKEDYDLYRDTPRAYATRSGFRRRMLDYAVGARSIPAQPSHYVTSQVS